MRTGIATALCLIVGTVFTAIEAAPERRESRSGSNSATDEFDEAMNAQPKLLRITTRCDGSGRIVFTRDNVYYEHRHWAPLNKVLFDGEPWTNLKRTPTAWTDYGADLDLTRARIVSRKGRDVIALERTAEGFDLYLSDSPNGGSRYSVTIAIPRRI